MNQRRIVSFHQCCTRPPALMAQYDESIYNYLIQWMALFATMKENTWYWKKPSKWIITVWTNAKGKYQLGKCLVLLSWTNMRKDRPVKLQDWGMQWKGPLVLSYNRSEKNIIHLGWPTWIGLPDLAGRVLVSKQVRQIRKRWRQA